MVPLINIYSGSDFPLGEYITKPGKVFRCPQNPIFQMSDQREQELAVTLTEEERAKERRK